MKDLTEIYIDLSKCSEEQRKHIISLLPEPKYFSQYDILDDHYTLHLDTELWWVINKSAIPDKTELTYPEFIKLFEGGEGENKERLYTLDEMSKCWIQATRKTHEPLIESGFSKFIESLNSK